MVSVHSPPRRGTVYSRSQPDYLVRAALAFLIIAVGAGTIFAWQGLRGGEPSTPPSPTPQATGVPSRTGGPGSVAQPTQASDAIPSAPASIRSASAGLCIAPGGDNRATLVECGDGPEVRWTVTAVPEQPEVYLITNAANNKCLDVNTGSRDDGVAILAWDCHRQPNQLWRVRRTGNGQIDLVSVATDKCVDVPSQAGGPGTQLQQWSCHNGPNQRFTFSA
jgi:hypothetical protein